MSQNDFTIANQTFPNTRADINSALQALASTSSGSSAPSTTFANQFFYNTTSNLLQIRNEANDAFITIAELDQTNDTVEYFKADAVRVLKLEYLDGDDAIIVNDGGGIICPAGVDLTATELILDADNDTTIRANTDDRIDFKIGGNILVEFNANGITVTDGDASQPNIRLVNTNANNSSSFLDFIKDSASPADDDAIQVIRCIGDNSSGATKVFTTVVSVSADVTAGTENGAYRIETLVDGTNASRFNIAPNGFIGIGTGSPQGRLSVSDGTVTTEINPTNGLGFIGNRTNHPIAFFIAGGEKARIDTNGIAMFKTTDTDPWNNGAGTAGGIALNASNLLGLGAFARVQGDPIAVNYIDGSNGNLIAFYHNGSGIGSISHSGGTVSYNAFTGSHPSRFANNSNPAILKGTVMETLDAMCGWYDFNYTGADSKDNDVAKVKEIVLPDGKSAGDSYTMEINGVSRTGTIVAKSNDKHMQCKISDTEDSTRIYGVFSDYLNGDTTVYNDMNINAVGTSVIRVASGTTVSAGDLLSSKGDGTAKLQGDDIIRTKTIGKVLSNVKQEIYDDGSFTIPSALYCG